MIKKFHLPLHHIFIKPITMKKHYPLSFIRYSLFIWLSLTYILYGQIPNHYYTPANNKSGYELKTALCQIITSGQITNTYVGLWTHFQTTDKRTDGKVWDMYSDCTFTFGTHQCGNYKDICDCYNREHSFPASWFNKVEPTYTDLFHLYPTDGKVNSLRGDYPFGETNGTLYTISKIGSCTFPGYTGMVFEPADEYKGDFARTYFYIATRYENQIKQWSCPMLAGNSTSVFKAWSIALLLKWHRQDPVSEKETNRNNAVYNIQKNRNPFIDYPDLVELIWGSKFGEPFLPEIIPTITGQDFACENSENIYRTDKGNSNYVWEVTGGNIIGTSNLDSVVVKWEQITTGTIAVRYNCNGTQSPTTSLNIDVRRRPIPQITGDRYILKNTEHHLYTTEKGKDNYLWSFSGNISLSEGGGINDNTALVDAGDEGKATISVNYTQDGCPALTPTVLNIEIVSEIGIDENEYGKITIVPNPSNKNTSITFEKPFSGTMYLYNIFGALIQQTSLQSICTHYFDISTYPNGIYILKLTTNNYTQFYKKIIKY